jgi:hypothetical protein
MLSFTISAKPRDWGVKGPGVMSSSTRKGQTAGKEKAFAVPVPKRVSIDIQVRSSVFLLNKRESEMDRWRVQKKSLPGVGEKCDRNIPTPFKRVTDAENLDFRKCDAPTDVPSFDVLVLTDVAR